MPHDRHLVPFLPSGHTLHSPLQKLPVVIQLFRGLVEVPSISGQCSFAQGDDCSTGGARESRNEFCDKVSVGAGKSAGEGRSLTSAGVTWRNVLGLVAIF